MSKVISAAQAAELVNDNDTLGIQGIVATSIPQYLAFRMADLQTEIDMCRYLLYKGVWEQQMGMDFAVSACKAKLACTDMAMKVTTECIQGMGGAVYMREQHVERMFRDAKITQIYEGTNEIQRLIISGAIFA